MGFESVQRDHRLDVNKKYMTSVLQSQTRIHDTWGSKEGQNTADIEKVHEAQCEVGKRTKHGKTQMAIWK